MCDDHAMRRHGWSGDIPANDDEAISRIIAAARRAIDQRGTVSVSEVAQALGVTRQTIYRYFPTHEALLGATALSSVDGFLNRLAAHLGSVTDPTEAVVEGIAYTFEQLGHDKYLSLVLQPGKASAFTAGVTSDLAISFGRSILRRSALTGLRQGPPTASSTSSSRSCCAFFSRSSWTPDAPPYRSESARLPPGLDRTVSACPRRCPALIPEGLTCYNLCLTAVIDDRH